MNKFAILSVLLMAGMVMATTVNTQLSGSGNMAYTAVTSVYGPNFDSWAHSINPSFVNTAPLAYMTAQIVQSYSSSTGMAVDNYISSPSAWDAQIIAGYSGNTVTATTSMGAWTVYPASEITGAGANTKVTYYSNDLGTSGTVYQTLAADVAGKYGTAGALGYISTRTGVLSGGESVGINLVPLCTIPAAPLPPHILQCINGAWDC